MLIRRLLIILAVCGLAACGAPATPAPTPSAAPAPRPTAVPTPEGAMPTAGADPASGAGPGIVDSAGRTVIVPANAQRIVSLAPSTSEIVAYVGAIDRLVAVDDFSDYPPALQDLPRIGGSDFTYDAEAIVALEPDLILAAGITSPDAVGQLTDLGLTVVVVGGVEASFEAIFADITLVGGLVGAADTTAQAVNALRERVAAVRQGIATVDERPRVYWEIDATDPQRPYSIAPGSFIHEILTVAGGENIFAGVANPYPQVSAEQIIEGDPQIIVMSNTAYGTTVESLRERIGWQDIAAVRDQQVFAIDDDLISRPGPRAVDGLEVLARLLHPERFDGQMAP